MDLIIYGSSIVSKDMFVLNVCRMLGETLVLLNFTAVIIVSQYSPEKLIEIARVSYYYLYAI